VRQLASDLAKIAQSWAVVPGFTFALLFAKAIALENTTAQSPTSMRKVKEEDLHVLVIGHVHARPNLSIGAARTARGLGSETKEVKETALCGRLFELTLLLPEFSGVRVGAVPAYRNIGEWNVSGGDEGLTDELLAITSEELGDGVVHPRSLRLRRCLGFDRALSGQKMSRCLR
jgi:hypothetical protein